MNENFGEARPKVLVLASTYPRWHGDTEPGFIHELARRLVDRFDVTVLCPHAKGAARQEIFDGVRVRRYRYAPDRFETLVNDGGIITNLRRARWKWLLVPSFFIAQWWVLRGLIRKLRPQVIHAHWLIPQGIITAAVHKKIPFVVTSHGADLFAIHGRIFTWLRSRVIARATAVTVVSQAMRQRLAIEHPGIGVKVLPMGVDFTSLFTPGNEQDRSLTSILFVGRLVEKKGVIHLINAMPSVLVKYPQAQLDIVGFGPELEHLVDQVKALGLKEKVNFLGPVRQTELPSLYRKAAVFVAPFIQARGGDQEGLGLVVVEAIACHCPVLVGDVPAVHDLIEGDKHVLVRQADVDALANAIIVVLDNPHASHERVVQMRHQLEKKLSWPEVAARYSDLLERAAE